MLVITCLPECMGKQPGRHTDWLCNGPGLSAATGTADGEVLTFAGGYGSRCQRHDTLSPGSREPSSEEITQVRYLLPLAEQFGCKGDGDEIAPTERCEERLRPTETAWIRAHNIAASVGWSPLTCLRFLASST